MANRKDPAMPPPTPDTTRRVRFDLVSQTPVDLEPLVTLRPRGGVQMRVLVRPEGEGQSTADRWLPGTWKLRLNVALRRFVF